MRLLPLISVFLLALIPAQGAPAMSRPNILFCIADDWGWPHAGAYGDKVVKTPHFDRVAREGILFNNAFCASPSCTPSRGAILTGRMPHQLEEGGNLWGTLPKKFAVYPSALEAAGYAIGHSRKAWGPGRVEPGGWTRNPAGPTFKSFVEFHKELETNTPFCFWFGSSDPHRPYDKGAGVRAGKKTGDVVVPGFFPDTEEVRSDILDYYDEIERFDREVGEAIALLESAGQLENTLVVITSDNGMPFPRCKANLYDSGAHMPLAVRWGARTPRGKMLNDFVSLADLGPTFLDVANIKPPGGATGRTLLPILIGQAQAGRDAVFFERERHANVRKGDLSYPSRAIRTSHFLYVWNLKPERWPAGDPEMWKAVGEYGDCDASPTKQVVLANPASVFFKLAFSKRPQEELYDLARDPYQTNNVAGAERYLATQRGLRQRLETWMRETGDPRITGGGELFETYPYYGDAPRMPQKSPVPKTN